MCLYASKNNGRDRVAVAPPSASAAVPCRRASPGAGVVTSALRKALVVDDDADVRTIAQLALSVDGTVEVVACGDGESAVAMAAQFLPDVVLLDVMMPDLDGPTTLSRIRAIESLARVPVIFSPLTRCRRRFNTFSRSMPRLRSLNLFEPMALLPKVRTILLQHEARPGGRRASRSTR